jgi:tetratricopeptide (TPR) repeat protein/CHAT domain-containing protein
MPMKKYVLILLAIFSVSTLSAGDLSEEKEKEAQDRYAQGEMYFNQGEDALAIDAFSKAIGINRNYAKAYAFRALVYAYQPDSFQLVLDDCKRALKLDKNIADAYKALGKAYRDHGDFDLSIANYTKAIDINPDDYASYNARGNVYLDKGDPDTAIINFNHALQIMPDYSGTYYYLGIAYTVKGELDLAIEYFTIRIQNSPDFSYAYSARGDVYHKKGELDRAISDHTQSLHIDPHNAHFYILRGSVYLDKGEFDLAIADNTQALQIIPNYAVAYNNRGRAYTEKGAWDLAIADLTKGLLITPDAKAYSNRAVAYENRGELDLALADYSQSLLLDPNNAITYSNRGIVYDKKGELDLSIADQKQAISIDPGYAIAYSNLGMVYIEKEELDLAIASFTQALIIDPNNAIAYTNRGSAYYDKGDLDLAINDCTQAIRLDPNDSFAYNVRANAYADKGEADLALDDFQKGMDVEFKKANINAAFVAVWREILWYLANKDYSLTGYTEQYFQLVIGWMEKTISLMENIRSSSGSRGTLDVVRKLYFYYAAVYMEIKANNIDKAFEYAESLRNRDFLDEVGRETALNLPGVQSDEREKIRALSREIEDYRNIIESYANEHKTADIRYTEISQKLDEAEAAIQKIDEAIVSRKVPRYEALRFPKPVTIHQAQAFCGDDTAVLEYVLWDDSIDYQPISYERLLTEEEKRRPAIDSYCLVLTKDGVKPVILDSAYAFSEVSRKFREQVAGANRNNPLGRPERYETLRNELYEKLITPVLPYLGRNIKNIVIVPDGDLAYLPFDILRPTTNSKDFGELFSLSLSPSISVSIIAERGLPATQNAPILGFANAIYNNQGSGSDRGTRSFDGLVWQNLPGTAIEIEMLKEIAESQNKSITVLLQKDVSEEKVKSLSANGELRKYPIIHFACHGYFNEEEPAMSGIVLSEVSGISDTNDGYLTVPEIVLLNFNSRMVLLSACETGLGENKRGRGMVGLTRAFLAAGAGNVGVSLWKVDDKGTSLFMEELYKKVLIEGKSFRAAYYDVKNQFRHGVFGETYARPRYWAAFMMYE